MNEETPQGQGMSRRDLMKRGAVVGGTLMWTAPAVQMLSRPAFAQAPGSPGGQGDCTNLFRFLFNVNGSGTGGSFDTGNGDADCKPANFDGITNVVSTTGAIPNNHGFVLITMVNARTATISLPGNCLLLSGDAKAGSSSGGTVECKSAGGRQVINGRNVYTVALSQREISNIKGIICCT